MNAVRIFNAREADELIFLDINASNENRIISNELVKKIGEEAYMPFAVGGGINNTDQMKSILQAGAEKIIINTAAVKDPELIRRAANKFGSSTLVVSIDVKKTLLKGNRVHINGGRKATKYNPVEFAVLAENLGAGEIMINSIDKDGTMQGYDINLIKEVSDSVAIPVIACGGAGNIEDLKEAHFNGHATALAAGSMFVYHGPRKAVLINYPDRSDIMEYFK
jgi:cyclase